MPAGTAAILNARSLANAHRHLATLVRPGLRVLDVGCGTGAITAGIAEAVLPDGYAVGVDVNATLIEEATQSHGHIRNLSFMISDIYTSAFQDAFDIVNAARVLQWLSRPADALNMLVAAAKPKGIVVVLDYNHEKIRWEPSPPQSVQAFYRAFLHWRADAGMDNAIADHLQSMFENAGLTHIVTSSQHETTQRGDADFDEAIQLWGKVIATRGPQIVADGMLTETERARAEEDFFQWGRKAAVLQTMHLLAVEGTRR